MSGRPTRRDQVAREVISFVGILGGVLTGNSLSTAGASSSIAILVGVGVGVGIWLALLVAWVAPAAFRQTRQDLRDTGDGSTAR